MTVDVEEAKRLVKTAFLTDKVERTALEVDGLFPMRGQTFAGEWEIEIEHSHNEENMAGWWVFTWYETKDKKPTHENRLGKTGLSYLGSFSRHNQKSE